eukprot:gene8939-11353_t
MRILDKEGLTLGLPEPGFFSDDAATFERLNPVTGEVATTAPAATVEDAHAACDAAAAAFPVWSALGPNARRALLNKAADALEAKAPQFIEAMMGEIGATQGWAGFNLMLAAGIVREAAAMDCRSGFRRFWTVILPLLAPTAFFLLIINVTYALFDTFGVIDVMVKDKAANNPITLVYKVYMDGFRGNDLGGSSAQSVILMLIVFVLTIFQFRFIERRVHYN